MVDATHHEFCKGCSGFFCGIPGVAGSSYVSGSGGLCVPSILSDRVIAMRAVIASSEGMFLYPAGMRFFFSVSAFSFSTLSVVRGSPPPADTSLTDPGGEDALLEESGETERVVGGCTAVESAADAATLLDNDKLDPVRSSWAARRGRDDGWFDPGAVTVPETLIRAAS